MNVLAPKSKWECRKTYTADLKFVVVRWVDDYFGLKKKIKKNVRKFLSMIFSTSPYHGFAQLSTFPICFHILIVTRITISVYSFHFVYVCFFPLESEFP